MLSHADGSLKMFHQEEPEGVGARAQRHEPHKGGRNAFAAADPQETARATEGSHLQGHNGADYLRRAWARPSAVTLPSAGRSLSMCDSSLTQSQDPGRFEPCYWTLASCDCSAHGLVWS